MRQTYLALKLKFVKGGGNETYHSKKNEKENKKEEKAGEKETEEEEQEAPVPLVTHVKNILHSIFSIVEVYINSQQIYNSNGFFAGVFRTTSRGLSLNTKEFQTARGTTKKNFLLKSWKCPCLNVFSQRERNCLADLMAPCCIELWGFIFSPVLNCYMQRWKSSDD